MEHLASRQCWQKGLELALACGGLVWITSQAIRVIDPTVAPGLLSHYAIEAVALSIGLVAGLLMQFRHGQPNLKMIWFCLGMAAPMATLGTMYFGGVAVGSLAPAGAAGIMATVRVKGNWDRLLRWFWGGVIAQVVLMVVLLAGAAITMRMGAGFPPGR